MNLRKQIAMIGVVLAMVAGSVTMATAEEWDLEGADRIVLDGVSGDVIVKQGAGRVEMFSDVRPRENFQVNVEQKGSTLYLEEDWSGSASGEVTWTFYVSGNTTVEIQTASGSFQAQDVGLDVDFQSASGDIELRNVELSADATFQTASGDFELQDMTLQGGGRFSTASGNIELDHIDVEDGVSFTTASGDVKATHSRGVMKLSSASGDVVLKESTPYDGSSFSSASGDVSLYLDEAPRGSLSASSASGDVLLDGAGSLGGGYTLVLVADMKKGAIDTPFEYSSERTIQKNRRDYMEKRVDLGSGGPEISLETSSGQVRVKN